MGAAVSALSVEWSRAAKVQRSGRAWWSPLVEVVGASLANTFEEQLERAFSCLRLPWGQSSEQCFEREVAKCGLKVGFCFQFQPGQLANWLLQYLLLASST